LQIQPDEMKDNFPNIAPFKPSETEYAQWTPEPHYKEAVKKYLLKLYSD
jgi:hypothetical protein|tara:strand:- start:4725 stop:4871 length:147 start_codon:yes stop_codon:yes gene_type:complete